jgi:hypothetical protein
LLRSVSDVSKRKSFWIVMIDADTASYTNPSSLPATGLHHKSIFPVTSGMHIRVLFGVSLWQ